MVKQNKQTVTITKTSLPAISASTELNEVDLRLLIYLLGFLDSNQPNAKPINIKSIAKCISCVDKKALKKSKKHLIDLGVIEEVPSNYSECGYILNITSSSIFYGLSDQFDCGSLLDE